MLPKDPVGRAHGGLQQAAAAWMKPDRPVPIKPERAAAPPPKPVAAPPGAAVSPKPAAAPAKPEAAADAEGAPTMMIMPAAPAKDSDVTMATEKAPRLRGIRLVGPGLPISLG